MSVRIFRISGWTFVLAVSFYFIYHNALNYFTYDQAHYYSFWPSFAPFLLLHVIFGMIALLLGPLQFIAVIRKRSVKVHHTIGKIYLVSIAISGVASLYLSVVKIITSEHDVVFGTGLFGLALAWLLTSGMAYWAVRHRNFSQHREWMVRSFVVTCGFASFRLFDNLLENVFHADPGASANVMAWACWAFPLLVTEVVLQAIKIRKSFKAMEGRKMPAVIKAV